MRVAALVVLISLVSLGVACLVALISLVSLRVESERRSPLRARVRRQSRTALVGLVSFGPRLSVHFGHDVCCPALVTALGSHRYRPNDSFISQSVD